MKVKLALQLAISKGADEQYISTTIYPIVRCCLTLLGFLSEPICGSTAYTACPGSITAALYAMMRSLSEYASHHSKVDRWRKKSNSTWLKKSSLKLKLKVESPACIDWIPNEDLPTGKNLQIVKRASLHECLQVGTRGTYAPPLDFSLMTCQQLRILQDF